MTRAALTARRGFTLGFAACAGLLAYAYYLQYVGGQEPCPLCMVQRVAYYALAAVFLAGALHGPARTGGVLYGGAAFVVAALGASVAARHVWLQHLPPDQVPACGPGLEYMLKQFPMSDVLQKVLTGSGECAKSDWKLLSLSIAEWSLAWFVVLGVFALWLAARGRTRRECRA
jgi:protein dithiol:quinone oxidoreductase